MYAIIGLLSPRKRFSHSVSTAECHEHTEAPTNSQQIKSERPLILSDWVVVCSLLNWSLASSLAEDSVGENRIVYPSLLSTASRPRALHERANQIDSAGSRSFLASRLGLMSLSIS